MSPQVKRGSAFSRSSSSIGGRGSVPLGVLQPEFSNGYAPVTEGAQESAAEPGKTRSLQREQDTAQREQDTAQRHERN